LIKTDLGRRIHACVSRAAQNLRLLLYIEWRINWRSRGHLVKMSRWKYLLLLVLQRRRLTIQDLAVSHGEPLSFHAGALWILRRLNMSRMKLYLETVSKIVKNLDIFNTTFVFRWLTTCLGQGASICGVHSSILLRVRSRHVLLAATHNLLKDLLWRYICQRRAFHRNLRRLWLSVLLHLLMFIVAHQLIVEDINVWLVSLFSQPSIVFTIFVCLLPLFLRVIKRAYFRFITSGPLLINLFKTGLVLHHRRFSYICQDGIVSRQWYDTCCT
jgi:hypothetical protein